MVLRRSENVLLNVSDIPHGPRDIRATTLKTNRHNSSHFFFYTFYCIIDSNFERIKSVLHRVLESEWLAECRKQYAPRNIRRTTCFLIFFFLGE